MDFTKIHFPNQFQNFELNPSSTKMPPNHSDQGNDKEITLNSQSVMQVEQDQSQVKLDTDKEKNIRKKHRKFVIVGASNAKVVNLPISGVFYDSFNNKYNVNYYREMFKNVVNITNQEIDPPVSECVQEYPNNKQNFHFAQYIYKYIKVPIFFVQSLYDIWCIKDVLGLNCTRSWWLQNLSTCTSTQMQLIESYRATEFDLLQQISSINNNGAWGIACMGHSFATEYKLNSRICGMLNWGPIQLKIQSSQVRFPIGPFII